MRNSIPQTTANIRPVVNIRLTVITAATVAPIPLRLLSLVSLLLATGWLVWTVVVWTLY